MKKVLLFILILSCCGFVAAQKQTPDKKAKTSSTRDAKNVFFQLSFGPTIDWFAPTAEKLDRNKAKAGYVAGIGIDVNITPKKVLYFSTGVLVRYLQGELAFENLYVLSNLVLFDTLIINTARTYQTTYLTIPTGIKVRTPLAKKWIFLGTFGFHHNFRISGKQFDNFSLPGVDDEYYTTTKKRKNQDAALFAESGYIGLGFEYLLGNNTRVSTNVNYGCQFNYFNKNAKNNVSGDQFKSIVHSLHIVVGFLF